MKPIHTQSAFRAFRKCPQYYKLSYVDGWKTVRKPKVLAVGSAFHELMEQKWMHGLNTALEKADEIVSRIFSDADVSDEQADKIEFQLAKLTAVLVAYDEHWNTKLNGKYSDIQVVDAERKFSIDVANFALDGMIDLVYKHGQKLHIMEHKTTTMDIGPESQYWLKLNIDYQISAYLKAEPQAAGVMYDVIRMPLLRPKKNETAKEYFERILAEMLADTGKYFQTRYIARLDSEMKRATDELIHMAGAIEYHKHTDSWYRNPESCAGIGICPFLEHCSGHSCLDNNPNFMKKSAAHEELGRK